MDQPPRIIGDYQQPQQQPQVPNVMNQMMQEERVSNFISQTSPTETLERINYILKGYVYDNSAKEWIKVSEGIPEKIRLDFLQFITPILSENVRMTNMSADQINGIMLIAIEWVVDYLDIVADNEKLQEEQMTKIAFILLTSIFTTLLRSQAGMENAKMFKSLSMTGDLNYNPQQLNQNQPKFWQFWK